MKTQSRTLRLDARSADAESRTIRATLSTENPVDRFGEAEILVHDSASIDFERAANGLPLLFAHDQREPIGLAEDVRIENRELKATLRFSRNPRAESIFQDIQDGTLRHVSIGYHVLATEQTETGYRVTRWKPVEASVVSVPADHTAQIGRNYAMTIEALTETEQSLSRSQRRAIREQTEAEHRAEARAATAERSRIQGIAESVRAAGLDEALAQQMIEDGTALDAARAEVLRKLAERPAPRMPTVTPGDWIARDVTAYDGRRAAMVAGLAIRCGLRAEHEGRQFAGLSLVELARQCLMARGSGVNSRSTSEIVSRALTSSDFPLLLSGLTGKVLQNMREADPASHQAWVKFGTTPNFKSNTRPALSSAPGLLEKAEGGSVQYGALAERGEAFTAKRYARAIKITREAIVNDDLSAFTTAARGFAQAALRLEADLAYAQLTANPVMADGNALFHASHGNLMTGASTAFSTTYALSALGAARAMMRKQKDPGEQGYLDVKPRFLLVPVALETLAESIIASLARVDSSNSAVNNPAWIRSLQIVADPRLDASSAAYWYLAADYAQTDTVEIAHLEGTSRGFTTVEEVDFDSDDLKIKATWEGGCAVVDWAGLLRSNGA